MPRDRDNDRRIDAACDRYLDALDRDDIAAAGRIDRDADPELARALQAVRVALVEIELAEIVATLSTAPQRLATSRK